MHLMNNWTIKKRISISLAVLLLLTAAIGVVNWKFLNDVGHEVGEIVSDRVPGLALSADVMQNANSIHLTLIRHVLAISLDEKRGHEAAIEKLAAENAELIAAAEKRTELPAEKEALEKIKQSRAAYIKARGPILQLSNGGKQAEALTELMASGRQTYTTFNAACMELNDLEAKLAQEAGVTVTQIVKSSKTLGATIALCELLGAIALGISLVTALNKALDRIAHSLSEGSSQIAGAAGHVSSASQALAEGASEQAASLEETSSSLEEMSSMTQRNAENSKRANELSKQARDCAERGSSDMTEMSAAMEALKASSGDIAKIIRTIDEIAFQTNILALNAAVEAARAGEAGMGFAVVADEVRSLAQRSAEAAKETSAKIEGAINRTSQGVDISAKVARGLGEIVDRIRKVDELVTEVAAASHEQSQGITQINLAVGQMDKVTQSNAASAEESASASEELDAQAKSLKKTVGDLLGLIGGHHPSKTDRLTASIPTPSESRTMPKSIHPQAEATQSHLANATTALKPIRPTPSVSYESPRSRTPREDDFHDF